MDDTPVDTRARIQRVAMDLFAERGYDKTSLREIAERLGVTKAALYYHFRSKEELLDSFLRDRLDQLDEMIAWLSGQPRTVEARRDFLHRYSQLLHTGQHRRLMQMFESNQAALRGMPAADKLRQRVLDMLGLLVDRDAPLTDQIRAGLALWAVHTSWFVVRDPAVADERLQEAALQVALELVPPPR
jgi:AcrR family transcriptional regulator